MAVAGMLVGGGTAFAQQDKDAVRASVSIPAEPVPVITENGHGYTPGNYAVGIIRLEYTYVGSTFPSGPLATFDLGMRIYQPPPPENPTNPVRIRRRSICRTSVRRT